MTISYDPGLELQLGAGFGVVTLTVMGRRVRRNRKRRLRRTQDPAVETPDLVLYIT